MGRHRTGPLNCTHCTRPSVGYGLCRVHKNRLRLYGTFDLPPNYVRGKRYLGNAEWQSLSDEPTYTQEYTGSIESLYALFGMHYRKPTAKRKCIDCGIELKRNYPTSPTRPNPPLRCRPCQDQELKYPRLW